MANTLNFNGFEVWLQLTSDESIFPLAESSIIGNTISVTVPLKICRKVSITTTNPPVSYISHRSPAL